MSIRTRIRTLTYAVLLFCEDNEYNNNHQVDGRSLMFNAIPLLMVGRAGLAIMPLHPRLLQLLLPHSCRLQ